MAWAILVWQPMASRVTRAPVRARRSSSSGMAVISFDLASVASCPSTRRCRAGLLSGQEALLNRGQLCLRLLPRLAGLDGLLLRGCDPGLEVGQRAGRA